MKMVLALATALTLGAVLAGQPGTPAEAAGRPGRQAAVAEPHRSLPTILQDAVRRAVGFDRLEPLLAKPR